MKKIVVLALVVLLSSCTTSKDKENSQIDNTNNEPVIIQDGIKETEEPTEDDIDLDIWEEIDNIIKSEIEETSTWTTGTGTGADTDEEALETEVNDLLDEFIDSLDSYEK